MSEDVLKKWSLQIRYAREGLLSYPDVNHCVRDLADSLEKAQARVAELETQCDRCGLKLAHSPVPGDNYIPVEVTYYPPVVTNAPGQPAQVTFYPQEVVYTPGELSQYPSKTVETP